MLSPLIARGESCARSWTPACAILTTFFAINSVRGSPRSLTQMVWNAGSYVLVRRAMSSGSKVKLIGDKWPLLELILVLVARAQPLSHM